MNTLPKGWMYHPKPELVGEQASYLLPYLWAQGEGTSVVQDGVLFRAEYHGNQKGVTAYVSTRNTPAGQILGLAREVRKREAARQATLALFIAFGGIVSVASIVASKRRKRR